jgi:hypothetical protein
MTPQNRLLRPGPHIWSVPKASGTGWKPYASSLVGCRRGRQRSEAELPLKGTGPGRILEPPNLRWRRRCAPQAALLWWPNMRAVRSAASRRTNPSRDDSRVRWHGRPRNHRPGHDAFATLVLEVPILADEVRHDPRVVGTEPGCPHDHVHLCPGPVSEHSGAPFGGRESRADVQAARHHRLPVHSDGEVTAAVTHGAPDAPILADQRFGQGRSILACRLASRPCRGLGR